MRTAGREVVEPNSDTAAKSAFVPTAAPKDTVRTRGRARWVPLCTVVVASVPIPAPLPYVATHVIYAKLVRLLLFHSMRQLVAVITIPSNIFYIVASAVCIASAFVSTSGCIFPFGFRRKPVATRVPVTCIRVAIF